MNKKTLEKMLENIEDSYVRSYFYRYQQWLLTYRQQILHNYQINRFQIVGSINLQKIHFYHLMNFSWEVNNYYQQIIMQYNSIVKKTKKDKKVENEDVGENFSQKDFNEEPINNTMSTMEDKIKEFLKGEDFDI